MTIVECVCSKKGHKLGELVVGDVVCEYCSTLACGDKWLPVWGVDKISAINIPGKPDGCNGQA